MKISWSYSANVACFGKIFNDGWARNHLDEVAEETLDLEGESMKQLRITYKKDLMLDIEDDITKDEIRELVEIFASEEVFIDGKYDEVDWEVAE